MSTTGAGAVYANQIRLICYEYEYKYNTIEYNQDLLCRLIANL